MRIKHLLLFFIFSIALSGLCAGYSSQYGQYTQEQIAQYQKDIMEPLIAGSVFNKKGIAAINAGDLEGAYQEFSKTATCAEIARRRMNESPDFERKAEAAILVDNLYASVNSLMAMLEIQVYNDYEKANRSSEKAFSVDAVKTADMFLDYANKAKNGARYKEAEFYTQKILYDSNTTNEQKRVARLIQREISRKSR